MRLISWNVNGLRAVLKKGFLDFMASASADVICLQEIKARPEQVEWLLPDGVSAHWNPAQKPGYSGTMTLTRQPVVNVTTGIGVAEGDLEGRVQTLEFDDFYLVNVYTPNSGNELRRLDFRTKEWDTAFREHCAALAAKKPTLFCGDLNVAHEEIDLANPKTNRKNAGFTDEERAEFTKHLEAGFIDTFRVRHPGEEKHYSWWSFRAGARKRNVGWRIDYFCASAAADSRVSKAFILPEVMGSDHCPVGVEMV
jgi:exodeoxyribonuclease-3